MRSLSSIRNRGKDELPHRTVSRIRNILHGLGISPFERLWVNSLDTAFSVRVEIGGTGFGTNGKGVGPEYALASAYGELMERIQNGIVCSNVDFDDEFNSSFGFTSAPDEQHIETIKFLDDLPDVATAVFPSMNGGRNDALKCLSKLEDDSSKPRPGHLLTVPYFSIGSNSLKYVPVSIRDYVYGSNGMAAGNTFPETIVQGLSEIFERYVQLQFLTKGMTPPTIPDTYLSEYKALFELKQRIESEGGCKVIVKDASLGRGFPVIGVIFMNLQDNSYFVRFGAHPVFEIALERCFTEYFQGRSLNNKYGYSQYRYVHGDDSRRVGEFENTMQIARSGIGIYPNNFFARNATYSFAPYQRNDFDSNHSMMTYLIALIDSMGYDILCRDVSFLGFPACHLIVPGLSEIYHLRSIHFQNVGRKRRGRQMLRSSAYLDGGEQMRETIEYIQTFYEKDRTIGDHDLIGFASTEDFPLKKVSLDIFLCIASLSVDDFATAHTHILREIEKVKNGSLLAAQYYRCVRDIIAMKRDSRDLEDIENCLSHIYSEQLVSQAIGDMENTERLFENVPQLPCFDCVSCKVNKDCHYQQVRDMLHRIKREMVSVSIDQMHLSTSIKWNGSVMAGHPQESEKRYSD